MPFDAIVASMTLGSVGYQNVSNENGERLIWLPRAVVDRVRVLRRAGESCSDVILALAGRASEPR
jgi:hypothetical protein